MILKVKKRKKDTKDSFSLILEKPEKFTFYPGQYLDIALKLSFPRKRESIQSRIFSLSSSPSEDFLMLTYKKGISPYKKRLHSLKAQDFIESSHPAGTVVIDDSSPIVMMAGGIGIAPHRSMIKWALDRKLNLPITLIYSNTTADFIFKKELDLWVQSYPNLTIHYIVTSKNGRLDKVKFKQLYPKPYVSEGKESSAYTLNPIFYLAGPPGMVDEFESILLTLKVDSINIRADRFDGY